MVRRLRIVSLWDFGPMGKKDSRAVALLVISTIFLRRTRGLEGPNILIVRLMYDRHFIGALLTVESRNITSISRTLILGICCEHFVVIVTLYCKQRL